MARLWAAGHVYAAHLPGGDAALSCTITLPLGSVDEPQVLRFLPSVISDHPVLSDDSNEAGT